MMAFLMANLANILIGAAVLAAVVLAVVKMARDKRAGSGCGCGCGACPSRSVCHGGEHEQKV